MQKVSYLASVIKNQLSPYLFVPIAVDEAVRAVFKRNIAATVAGVAAGACAGKFLSRGQCLLMAVVYVAYKVGYYYLEMRELGNANSPTNVEYFNKSIEEIPPEVYEQTKVTCLNLGHNKIKKISGDIGKLTNLKELWLNDNQLTTLPSEIGNLRKLIVLNLFDNALTTIPDGLAQLPRTCTICLTIYGGNEENSKATEAFQKKVSEQQQLDSSKGPRVRVTFVRKNI